MRLLGVVTLAAIVVAPGRARADDYDVEAGIRWSGGFGATLDETRPVFMGSFGMDAGITLSGGHGIAASLDMMWRERPSDDSGAIKIDADAKLLYTWHRGIRRSSQWDPWLAVGGGYRQLVYDDVTPALGQVRLHGVNLTFRGGADRHLGDHTWLGVFFDWTLGCYLTSDRRNADDYIAMYDEPAPAPRNPSCIDTGTSMYAGGLRLSARFD